MKMFHEVETINIPDKQVLEKARVAALCEYDRYLRDYGHAKKEEGLWYVDGEAFTGWFRGNIRDFFHGKPGGEKKLADGERDLWRGAHKVNNTVVWLNGDRAVAEVMCTLIFRNKVNGDWFDSRTYSRMHYRAEKRDGKWGLLYFAGIYEWGRLDPVFHDSEITIPREEVLKYRDHDFYRYYSKASSGRALFLPDEQPGPDRPETIQTIYDATSKWFFGEE